MFKVISIVFLMAAPTLHAAQLVTKETVAKQKKATVTKELDNGIPVVFREIKGSDILNVLVTFDFGLKDIPTGKKSYGGLAFSTMGMAASGYPKTKVFRTTEKYALELGCSSGIEMSTCAIGLLNDHWPQVRSLFGAIVKKPSLSDTDLKLQAERNAASIKGTIQSSDRYVNEIVNGVFYEEKHPFRQSLNNSLKELENYKRTDIVSMHKTALNAKRMTIVVVGSYNQKKMLADLNKMFGKVAAEDYEPTKVEDPKFNKESFYRFENRDIPTAYIRAKFNGLARKHKDSVAQTLMIKVLDEELGEEIRTKRSLSYAVWSHVIPYSIGIGMLSVSTSKPEETLEAMSLVLDKMVSKKLTKQKLEEYKTVYATKYFLTLETHSSLAGAIASTYYYFKSVDPLYELPLKLEKITPKDVLRVAKKTLNNMRVGVVFNEKKFKKKWAQGFVKKSLRGGKKSKS